MEYSDEMTTSIADLRNKNNFSNKNTSQYTNLGKELEYELDNYKPDVIPQATLQKAPPMRQGKVETFQTHQLVNNNNFYPDMGGNMGGNYVSSVSESVEKKGNMIESLLSNIYLRVLDPILLTILFIIFSHRFVAKGINSYLPFVGLSPSTDFVSLGLRGFLLSVIYLLIKSQL